MSINFTSPANPGDIYSYNGYIWKYALGSYWKSVSESDYIYSATTSGTVTSDLKNKKNIEYIETKASDLISKLKPVKFEFKNNEGVKRHGFIAQDFLEVEPDLVLGDGYKENGTYWLDYDGILAMTLKTLQ